VDCLLAHWKTRCLELFMYTREIRE
jgi:hypothetical protein